ncbi:MAG: SigB/SigF/SigG family RNA polymerase sigma factor [bacterium]
MTDRKAVIEENMPLVYSIAGRMVRDGYELEDLIQIGMIGLIKAVDNFDPAYGTKLSTYAVPLIMGEIRRTFRDQGTLKVGRRLKYLATQIWHWQEEFIQKEGREPLIGEIALALDLAREEIVAALEAVRPVLSFEQKLSVEDDDLALIDLVSDEEGSNNWLTKMAFRQAFQDLTEREQKIFIFRFWQDKTQTEVAKLLGVSQVQISRLEKKILKKIKTAL